jgi:LysM repeat protein
VSVTTEPDAPSTALSSDHGAARDTGAQPTERRPESETAAVLASRRLCPYLTIDGGSWRSAEPDRDHRCGALEPMPPLTLDKQRRLCLTDRHLTCATFLAARGLDGASGDDPERPIVAVGPGRPPDLDTVTRWSIVRTTPVILDRSRLPVVGSLPRGRAAGQLGLAVLLVAAFAALAIGRLTGPSAPARAGAGAGATPPTGSAPIFTAASPTATAEATPTPTDTPKPSRTPKPSKSPAPTPTPSPTASPNSGFSTTYKVKSGDTLYGISIRFNTSVKAIQQLNNLKDTTLHIGQVLKIP